MHHREAGFHPVGDAVRDATAKICLEYFVLLHECPHRFYRISRKGPFLFDSQIAQFKGELVTRRRPARRLRDGSTDVAGFAQWAFVMKQVAEVNLQSELAVVTRQ